MPPRRFGFWRALLLLYMILSMVYKSSACLINIPEDIPNDSPVFMYKAPNGPSFQPLKPTTKVSALPIGSQLLLSCVDKVFIGAATNILVLNCGRGNKFEINGRRVDLKSLSCNGIASPSVRPTANRCANNAGVLQLAGYEYYPGSFAAVYQMCYDLKTNTHFYSKHEINGAAIAYARAERYSHFRSDGTGHRNSYFDKFYGFKDVSKTCNNIPKNRQNFPIRGHFTPNADFVFPYERVATFFYMNVAPEFQSVNNGNWKAVENIARNIAIAYNDSLTVFTGGYGTLRLPNLHTGQAREVFLDCEVSQPKRPFIKAPLFYFKVLYSRRFESGIAFLTLNNPYATAVQLPCRDICKQTRFFDQRFHNYVSGHTICCDINEFNRIYPYLSLLPGIKLMVNPFRS